MPIKESAGTIAIVEDSSNYANCHKQHLKNLGVETVIFRSAAELDEFFEENKAIRLKAVITDGLEGNWRGVVESAQKHNVGTIWLVTGNSDCCEQSRHYPGVKYVRKADLHSNPEQYKKIIE